MTKYTDQHLSAYIDGELSEALTNDLRAALQQDADLAKRLHVLERANEEFLSAHRGVTEEPIPERFLDVIDRAPTLAEHDDTIVNFPVSGDRIRTWLMPLAACLVLAVGVVFGARLSTDSVTAPSEMMLVGPINSTSDLHQALETAPSGELENGITAILTFATSDGGYCRELAIDTARALACRDPQSVRWTLLAVASQPSRSDETAYYPASVAGSASIGSLVDQLIIGIPMTPDEEEALIRDSWRSPSDRNSPE